MELRDEFDKFIVEFFFEVKIFLFEDGHRALIGNDEGLLSEEARHILQLEGGRAFEFEYRDKCLTT